MNKKNEKLYMIGFVGNSIIGGGLIGTGLYWLGIGVFISTIFMMIAYRSQ